MRLLMRLALVRAVVLGSLARSLAQTSQDQVSALLAIKSAWPSKATNTWSSSTDPCASPGWTGVGCNTNVTPPVVTGLDLKSSEIYGTLPSSLWSITSLQSLNLGANKNLGGTVPDALSSLVQLTFLNLQNCSFWGSIPSGIGSLLDLIYLSVAQNSMGGSLPSQLGNLRKLYWFDITQNHFTGPLPDAMAEFPSLHHLHLSYNNLTALPMNIATLPQLEHLLIDNNNVNQPLPPNLLSMPNTTIIQLSNNTFLISNSSELEGNAPNLYEFVASNALHSTAGPLPLPNFEKMPGGLEILDLSYSDIFVGPLPSTVTYLEKLLTLKLNNNSLTGGLPAGLTSLPLLEELDMANNSLSEPVPDVTGLRLLKLHLEGNNISQVALANLNPTNTTPNNTFQIFLYGNPVCNGSTIKVCQPSCDDPWTNKTNDQICPDKAPACQSLTAQSASGSGQFFPSPLTCACVSPLRAYLYLNYTSFPTFTDARADYVQRVTVESMASAKEPVILTPSQVIVSEVVKSCGAQTRFLMTLDFYPPAGASALDTQTVQGIENFLSSALGYLGYETEFGLQRVQQFVPPAELPASGGGLSAGQIAGIVVGCVLGVALLVALVAWLVYQRTKGVIRDTWTDSDYRELEAIRVQGGVTKFQLKQLNDATDSFSQDRLLGEGGYGKVYKAILPPKGPQERCVVAVKRAKVEMQSGGAEFRNEIELLSRVHHRNLVGLMGYCREAGEELLVYEFVARGTLSAWIHGPESKKAPLTWEQRLHIALGAAKGLAYLHHEVTPTIIHRDIKSGNILLDEGFNAKVADFGLSKEVEEEQSDKGVETKIKGTAGYLDPEYYLTDLLTEKSDVYSFGIVLLELATGWRVFQDNQHIRGRVCRRVNESGILSIVDGAMPSKPDAGSFEEFVRLAMQCCTKKATSRPTMREVQSRLQDLEQGGSAAAAAGGHASSSTRNESSSGAGMDAVFAVDEEDGPAPFSMADVHSGSSRTPTSGADFSEDSGAYIGPDGELYDNSGVMAQSGVVAK